MRKMDEEQKLKIKNRLSVLSIIVLAVVALIWFLISKDRRLVDTAAFAVVPGYLVFHWILMNVVEPKMLGMFEEMSAEGKMQYLKSAAANLLGYGGLTWFVYQIGRSNKSAMIGGIVYIVCVNIARKAKDRFYEGMMS